MYGLVPKCQTVTVIRFEWNLSNLVRFWLSRETVFHIRDIGIQIHRHFSILVKLWNQSDKVGTPVLNHKLIVG